MTARPRRCSTKRIPRTDRRTDIMCNVIDLYHVPLVRRWRGLTWFYFSHNSEIPPTANVHRRYVNAGNLEDTVIAGKKVHRTICLWYCGNILFFCPAKNAFCTASRWHFARNSRQDSMPKFALISARVCVSLWKLGNPGILTTRRDLSLAWFLRNVISYGRLQATST